MAFGFCQGSAFLRGSLTVEEESSEGPIYKSPKPYV